MLRLPLAASQLVLDCLVARVPINWQPLAIRVRHRHRGIEGGTGRQRDRRGSNNHYTACLCKATPIAAGKHRQISTPSAALLEFVAQPDTVPPIPPAAPHPVQVPSTSPPPPGAQKAGQPLGVYYWAAAGAISPPPRPVASLVPASEPPLSLRLRISSAFTGAGLLEEGSLFAKTLFRSHIDRASAAHSGITVSALLFSSTLRQLAGFAAQCKLSPSASSPPFLHRRPPRAPGFSSLLVRFFFVASLLPVHDIV